MTLLKRNWLGDWNPQLFRELKGRLKPRNILIAVAVSLLGQLLLLMSLAGQLPKPDVPDAQNPTYSNRYCTGKIVYSTNKLCISDNFGSFEINWQLWWQDVFIGLSAITIIALLVVGTYMLISDLSKEEQRGTLNFLRLSPQSSQSILFGKMLGVPFLLYLVGFLAVPLHLAAGLSGGISLSMILGFYAALGASCLFFYSAALLFGLVGTWLSGFQAWLGSGMVLMFLRPTTVMSVNNSSIVYHTPLDWITLFSPSILLPYFTETTQVKGIESLNVWNLPVGGSVWSTLGLMLLNYGLWTYWAWQGLKRCFHKPSGSLLSKQQSYWLTACFEAVILGFALNSRQGNPSSQGLFWNFQMLLVFNLQLFLCLIAMLSPHRQAMQDWARYRHQKRSARKGGVISDLIWGEKSPALVAIVLNVAIASAMLLPWIALWPASKYKTPALSALLLNMSLIVVCAAVAQLMLFMKMPKRAPWAAATVGLMIVLPPIIFGLLSLEPSKTPDVWLFSAFPWAAVEYTSQITVFLAIIGQSLATGLLSLQLTRQLHKAGESSTKALLSGRPPVANV
jgi:hypothetical protein